MSENAEPTENTDTTNFINSDIERRSFRRFCKLFAVTASCQGRLAYFIMSFHAVNPYIMKSLTNYEPKPYIFANMIYGIGVMLYSRHSMRNISVFNRAMFSILGSLMFNHSSMLLYEWLVKHLSDRPYLLTFFGYLAGRIMMLHLLAYLYHVDSRSRGFHVRQYPEYESMYRQQ